MWSWGIAEVSLDCSHSMSSDPTAKVATFFAAAVKANNGVGSGRILLDLAGLALAIAVR